MVRRHADRLRALVLAGYARRGRHTGGKEHRAALAQKVLREGAVAVAEAFVPKLLGDTTKRERPQVVARVREMVLATRRAASRTP